MLFSGSDYKVSEVDARKSISVNGGIVFVLMPLCLYLDILQDFHLRIKIGM